MIVQYYFTVGSQMKSECKCKYVDNNKTLHQRNWEKSHLLRKSWFVGRLYKIILYLKLSPLWYNAHFVSCVCVCVCSVVTCGQLQYCQFNESVKSCEDVINIIHSRITLLSSQKWHVEQRCAFCDQKKKDFQEEKSRLFFLPSNHLIVDLFFEVAVSLCINA